MAMASTVICLSAEEGIAEEQVQADDAVAAAVQETVAEDVTNEAIPSTPTPLILPSPPSHEIPSTTQVQSLPPQQPKKFTLSSTTGCRISNTFVSTSSRYMFYSYSSC
uniref:Uncharacterized protein n=1 Tax=Tanacetum cinerariifolium TaxID=118510 RepID=A0A699SWJ8_TANCI|nr:hypothetical protein [Tanacetum cinerariifolium]